MMDALNFHDHAKELVGLTQALPLVLDDEKIKSEMGMTKEQVTFLLNELALYICYSEMNHESQQ